MIRPTRPPLRAGDACEVHGDESRAVTTSSEGHKTWTNRRDRQPRRTREANHRRATTNCCSEPPWRPYRRTTAASHHDDPTGEPVNHCGGPPWRTPGEPG